MKLLSRPTSPIIRGAMLSTGSNSLHGRQRRGPRCHETTQLGVIWRPVGVDHHVMEPRAWMDTWAPKFNNEFAPEKWQI